jgi:hypothetical protein
MLLRKALPQGVGVAALLCLIAAPSAWSQAPKSPTDVALDYVQQN